MAKRGSKKQLSVKQEEFIADAYKGKRSASSGAAVHDRGDVRTPTHLIECKHSGTLDKPAKSISVKVSDLDKIADEAWSESKNWAVALRIYNPDSLVSDSDGFIDLIVRPVVEDKWRN
jgi:hypothetical protein